MLEILGKVSAIVTAIGVCIIPWLVAHWQAEKRKKGQHFQEIKDNILRLIEGHLNKYDAILENKKLGIKDKVEREMSGDEITFDDYKNKPLREAISPEVPISLNSTFKERRALFDDCKKNHFPEFFQKLQEFENKFDKYIKLSIQYVEKLRTLILQKVSLVRRG